VQTTECQLLYSPDQEALRFLPEGPYPYGESQLSWVAIQHGAEADYGSLNLLDLRSRENRNLPLKGRPGFAFPSDRPGQFVVGLERQLQRLDLESGETWALTDPVDADVQGTIINDGVVFSGGLVFGCKDLAFRDPKAGLYLWRAADGQLVRLRDDQICSNGKVVLTRSKDFTLLDIDSPRKTVVAYELDVARGRLSTPRVVIDLRDQDAFPDGMVATPDEQSVLIAMYNPQDVADGQVRQYGLQDGDLQAVWQLPGAPQATCPQLVKFEGRVKLIVTTAVEHMPVERRETCPNCGCLFVGETQFQGLPATPAVSLPA
jgi:sugar lactone lactonase YvrE